MTDKKAQDSVVATLQTVEGAPARKEYEVTSKAGLFKNGKLYKQGDTVLLDDQTASAFLVLEEVKEK
jgi:hypothetical protein